jgi:hypothetical protein
MSPEWVLRLMRTVNSQPIILALTALVVVAVGLGSIGAWRSYTGTSPEQDRVTSARLLQARTAQVAEELILKGVSGIATLFTGVNLGQPVRRWRWLPSRGAERPKQSAPDRSIC